MKSYKDFVLEYAKYCEEIGREEYLIGAGLKSKCDTDAISKRFAHLLTRRNYEDILKRAKRARNPEKKEMFMRMAWALMDSIVAAEYSTDEFSTTEVNAVTVIDGERHPFPSLRARQETHPDPGMREKFAAAYLRVIDRKLNPLLKEMKEGQLEAYRRFSMFLNTWEYVAKLKQVDFELLRRRLLWLVEETERPYLEMLNAQCMTLFGKPAMEADAEGHVYYLAYPMLFGDRFPKTRMIETCAKTLAGLGLHFGEMPNLMLDTEDRPKKDHRAFCQAVKVPDEVRLVIRAHDGFSAYKTFLHEAGHAWHYACTDPKLPFEFGSLARSHALTETYAFLTEHISHTPEWLCDIAGLSAKQADQLSAACHIGNMLLLRRYIGKLCYELEHAAHPTDDEWNRKRYSELLTRMTGFPYSGIRYLHDMDGSIGSVDYLLAWINERHLRRHMIAEFGKDWWRRKEAGDLLRELWKEGDRIGVKELAERLGADHLDTRPLKGLFSREGWLEP